MPKNILQELERVMKERNVKIPALSGLLDIPKDRIYKWYQEGTSPKMEDSNKIWNWINGEKDFTVNEPDASYSIRIDQAMKIIDTQADIIKSQQETIQLLTLNKFVPLDTTTIRKIDKAKRNTV